MSLIRTTAAAAFALLIPAASASAVDVCRVDETVQLHDQWRQLWTEHVVLEHAFIVSAVEKLDDRDILSRRMTANARRMANALERYYGSDTEQALGRLFDQHNQIFMRFVDAVLARDSERVSRLRLQLLRNADRIAATIDRAHRDEVFTLDEDERSPLRAMMRAHVTQSARVLHGRLTDDFETEQSTQARVLDGALEIADYISSQIIDGFLRPSEPFCRETERDLRDSRSP